MLDFFNQIGSFISAIGSFIGNLIDGIFQLFQWVGISIGYTAELALYIPSSLIAISLVFITVAVIFLIVGR